MIRFANRPYRSYRIGLPRPGRWRVRLNSDWKGYGADFGNHPSGDVVAVGSPADGMPRSGELSIGPYTALPCRRTSKQGAIRG